MHYEKENNRRGWSNRINDKPVYKIPDRNLKEDEFNIFQMLTPPSSTQDKIPQDINVRSLKKGRSTSNLSKIIIDMTTNHLPTIERVPSELELSPSPYLKNQEPSKDKRAPRTCSNLKVRDHKKRLIQSMKYRKNKNRGIKK